MHIRRARQSSSTLLCLALVLGTSSAAWAQTVTLTAAGKTFIPWDDYATQVLRDPWDMNQRTDIGWYTWGVDQPTSNMTSKQMKTDAFGRTVFSGIPGTNDPSFILLDTPSPGASPLGKLGSNFPINAKKYTRLLVAMRIGGADIRPSQFGSLGGPPVMVVYFSRDTIYYDAATRPTGGTYLTVDASGNTSGTPATVFSGCNAFLVPCGSMEGGRYVIYSIPVGDIAAMKALNPNIAKWKNIADPTGASDRNWEAAGTIDFLRFQPLNVTGSVSGTVDVDWVRLVDESANNAPETISWTGGAAFDVVVSTAADCGAGNGDYSVLAYSKASGFQFNPQMLPNGTYFVGLRDRFTGNGSDTLATRMIRSCSSGSFTVIDYPNLTFTSPSPTGSADDFATVALNNPWDFNAAADIDLNVGIASGAITTIPAERPDGTLLGNTRAFFGTSTQTLPGLGDPRSYLIRSDLRGLNTRIDTSRYRLLTIDMGLDRARDLFQGSIVRVIWHIAGETWDSPAGGAGDAENVSQDILLRHLQKGTASVDTFGVNYIMDRIQFDLSDRVRVPLETDLPLNSTSPSRTGWSNIAAQCASSGCPQARLQPFNRVGVDNFRIDPHEFDDPTRFFYGSVKLAAHEKSGSTFSITWDYTMPDGQTSGTFGTAANWKVRLYAVPTQPESPSGARNASPGTPVTRSCTDTGTGIVALTTPGTAPTLASGAFSWDASATSGLTFGALYFICAGLIVPGTTTPTAFVLSQFPIVYTPGDSPLLAPRLFLDRTTLNMAATHTQILNPPNLVNKTPAQTVTVTQIGGTSAVSWNVDVCQNYDPASPPTCTGSLDYIQLSRTSGAGTGTFTVQLKDSPVLPFTTGASVIGVILRVSEKFSATTSNSPQYVQIYISLRSPAQATLPPVGQVDTPAPNLTGVQGAIGVTGWVVDDVGVTSVKIYRNCLAAFEPAACQNSLIPGSPATQLALVGDANFLAGARPDVEATFSRSPLSYQAGWGFLLLTNMFPRTVGPFASFGGQGPITLYAVATDVEGNRTLLGRSSIDHTPTSITMDNDNILKPFGAIDTPTQGGSVSNTFANFGWAVTPDLDTVAGNGDIAIPTNGSSMVVVIDGVNVGNVGYDNCRGTVGTPVPANTYCNDDIANIFGNPIPQPALQTRTSNPTKFRNLDAGRGAIGAFQVNTAGYGNGLHSIAWGVTDSANRVEGIGSRNFIVVNGVSDAFAAPADTRINRAGPDAGQRVTDLEVLARLDTPLGLRKGMIFAGPYDVVSPTDGVGHVIAKEVERIEIGLPGTLSDFSWDGYFVQDGRLTPLPPGSYLDAKASRFYWQSVAGYIGDYDFLFVRHNAAGTRERLPVRVTFEPKFGARPHQTGPADPEAPALKVSGR